MTAALTLLGLAVLAYIYGGYAAIVNLAARLAGHRQQAGIQEALPTLTVLLTVHNEAVNIRPRIANILDCEYPADRLEILVASDGSTDGTDDIVAAISDPRVRLFRPKVRQGKSDTQNQALASATGDVVVFTDAGTRFHRRFLVEIARPFAMGDVGGVDGHLLFGEEFGNGVSRSQGFYWRQELMIRQAESALAILAVASGACMAVRRNLLRPLPATVGEDCVVPLDVISQGFRMIHADQAVALDRMEFSPEREFRTRVRMTLRNWQGTWAYRPLLNPWRSPGIAIALWSHKLLRWLSPAFLGMWLGGSVTLVARNATIIETLLGLPGVAFLVAGILGFFAHRLGWRLPVVGFVYAFFLANAGFLVGILKGMVGAKVTAYK